MIHPGDRTSWHPGKISDERGFTMIATYNVKVNGRWYHAGEELPGTAKKPAPVKEPVPEKEQVKEPEPVPEQIGFPIGEEPVTEPTEEKPKTASRRRTGK
jgi:hypothetical protein